MDSSTRQVTVVPITSGPLEVEGTSDSDGLPFKDYKDTSNFSFQCFPRQHFW
jgi:hypothetical protein